MIDDSLVRGTTAGPLVKLVRDAGATEVHLRITCPPITHACHFGVDMGHDGDLAAAHHTVEEIRERIGADSLAFLSLDGMMRAVTDDVSADGADGGGYCNACFTGRYPLPVGDATAKLAFEGVLLVKVAVIGGGGREPAIAWACARHGHDVDRRAPMPPTVPRDGAGRPDLVIVGPEAALAAGVADELTAAGIACFGPTAVARPARVVEGARPARRRPPVDPVAGVPRHRRRRGGDRLVVRRSAAPWS